jgi:hypothetical protein
MGLLSAFFYNRKGKRLGNEIADSMMISRSLFHSAVVKGGQIYHLPVIASMHDEGHSLNDIRKSMIPYLAAGLDVLEREHGHQSSIVKAREVVNIHLESDDDIRLLADGMRAMTSDDPVSAMKEFESQIVEAEMEDDKSQLVASECFLNKSDHWNVIYDGKTEGVPSLIELPIYEDRQCSKRVGSIEILHYFDKECFERLSAEGTVPTHAMYFVQDSLIINHSGITHFNEFDEAVWKLSANEQVLAGTMSSDLMGHLTKNRSHGLEYTGLGMNVYTMSEMNKQGDYSASLIISDQVVMSVAHMQCHGLDLVIQEHRNNVFDANNVVELHARMMSKDSPVSAMKEFDDQIAEQDKDKKLEEDVSTAPVSSHIEVTSNNWERDGKEIKRVIQYEGALGEGIISQLHISYVIEPGMVMPHRHMFFMNGPSLGFAEGYLVARIWSQDGASEDDTGFFVVRVSETQDGLATLFGPEPGDDPDEMRQVLAVCSKLFSSGEDLLISLSTQEEDLMRLPIPGGGGFSALLDEALDAARAQSGSIFD